LFISQFEPRVFPSTEEYIYIYILINKYASSDDAGKNSFMWVGPKPRVNIMNPDQIKDVFMKINEYQKPSHPLLKALACGLPSHEGEKWSNHRKIINPAFHQEKIKVIMIVSTYLPISIHAIRLP
jgi:cytochrome P450